jgi:hypothetical protein
MELRRYYHSITGDLHREQKKVARVLFVCVFLGASPRTTTTTNGERKEEGAKNTREEYRRERELGGGCDGGLIDQLTST